MPAKLRKTTHINLAAQLKTVARRKVLVGIPQATASRKDEPINNAELLAIHTHGSPLQGIPARPVIEPAIAYPENAAIIARELAAATKAGLDGNGQANEDALNRAGVAASNAAKDWFFNPANNWAPNSTRPLGHWLAEKVSERMGREVTADESYVDAKGSDQPLIDTGQMRRAITYVVEPK